MRALLMVSSRKGNFSLRRQKKNYVRCFQKTLHAANNLRVHLQVLIFALITQYIPEISQVFMVLLQ